LRHQLGVLRRSAPKQLKLTPADRMLWVWLRRVWSEWKSGLLIVKPATVIACHKERVPCVLELEDPVRQAPASGCAAGNP
jgi:hypothetical protein